MDWIKETRLRVLLTLGLGGNFDTSDAEDEAEPEAILVTRVVVPSTIPEDDERDEDDQTEVGYRESPGGVKLEVLEIISGEPLSAVGIVPGAAEDEVKPKPFGHQGEGPKHEFRHAPAHHAHKDEETAMAGEAGV